jgi:hypothetical protein
MLNLQQYPRRTALIVAILLALSSSGFTSALRSCLMPDHACCSAMGTMAHMPGDEGAIPGILALKSPTSCCSVTVAGGLNTNPIIAGTQQPSFHHLDLLAPVHSAAPCGAQPTLAHLGFSSFEATASPPLVERYLLDCTFLI